MPVSTLGGVAIMGQRFLDRYYGGGSIIWVGNRSGLPSGDGSSPEYPCASVFGAQGALAKLNATTARGHVVLVLPGHAENVSAADMASHQGAANSFAICGLGHGTTRATFTWSAATATWLLDTADNVIDNCRLLMAGPSGSTAITVAAPMTISGDGCAIRGCYIQTGIDADQLSTASITVTGDDVVIEDNQIIGAAAAEQTDVIILTGADRVKIRRNFMSAALATDTRGLIRSVTTLSANVEIVDNWIEATGTGNETCIDFAADLVCTGLIDRNMMRNRTDANNNYITHHANNNLTLGGVSGNFGVNNANERGIIEGTATV